MSTTLDIPNRPAPLLRPAWLPEAVWPFDTSAIDLDGGSIAISEVGHGPTLIFYTGIGSFIWRDVVFRLSADFRCIVVDPPGIGLSSRVPRSETTLANSKRAVIAAVQALELNDFVLVIHDTAGVPAIAAGAHTPDRVRGIVGVNTFAWKPVGPAFRGMLALMGSPMMRWFDLATGLLARVTATSFGVGRHLDDESRQAFRTGLTQSMGAFHDYLRDARVSNTIFDDVRRAVTGPFQQLPVLTIFGERNDPLGFQPRWKQFFPKSRQIVVPKGNHFPMCDDPDLVANAIRSWHHEFFSSAGRWR
jgi:haloalkane dehalogenase